MTTRVIRISLLRRVDFGLFYCPRHVVHMMWTKILSLTGEKLILMRPISPQIYALGLQGSWTTRLLGTRNGNSLTIRRRFQPMKSKYDSYCMRHQNCMKKGIIWTVELCIWSPLNSFDLLRRHIFSLSFTGMCS